MSLQERTLVVRNFDPDKTTNKLLKELCLQAGPLRKVVVRPDHAFVEFDHFESVGYAKALLDGTVMFGKTLQFEPKLRIKEHFKYVQAIDQYIEHDKRTKAYEEQQRQMRQYQQMLIQQMQQGSASHPVHQPPSQYPNYNQSHPYQYQPPPPPNGFY